MSQPPEILWSSPAVTQLLALVEGRPDAFVERVMLLAEAITGRLGAGAVGWVQVQEAVEQVLQEEEGRR